MSDFTPVPALLGGILIGTSASLLFFTHKRIAGISGILGGALQKEKRDPHFHLPFLFGLLFVGALARFFFPELVGLSKESALSSVQTSGIAPILMIALSGLLVGFGTRLGNGCTSGHGVCGLSRLSVRSLVGTLCFIGSGALTVTLLRIMNLGGLP